VAEIQAQFGEFVQFLSDPSQPSWMKLLAGLGVALAAAMIVWGLWLFFQLPSLIAAAIVEASETGKGASSGLILDLARLKNDYDTFRTQGFSREDAMRAAGDKAIARSKAESEKRPPPHPDPPPVA